MKSSSIKAREGSSLAIVICVSAFLMAFALAMLYAAGLSVSRANRRLEQERKEMKRLLAAVSSARISA